MRWHGNWAKGLQVANIPEAIGFCRGRTDNEARLIASSESVSRLLERQKKTYVRSRNSKDDVNDARDRRVRQATRSGIERQTKRDQKAGA